MTHAQDVLADGRLPLSVAIITKDEADRLPDCLASVTFAAQVVVVDSGSTDGTLEIAARWGAQVDTEPWQGYGRQKQLAIDRCQQPWILVLDADERVSPELGRELAAVLASGSTCAAYSLPRKNFFFGRWLRHAGWWPDRVTRLFKRGAARMSDRLVHEALVVEGELGSLQAPLIHLTSRDLAQTIDKINRYSSAGARELCNRGQRASIGKALAHMIWAFINNYFLRLGILDGGPGLIQALTDASNTLFKYLKLWELGQASRRPPRDDW